MTSRTFRLLSTAGISLSLGVVSLLGATAAAASLQAGIVPPNNPPKSLPPRPNFFNSAKCSYDQHPNGSYGCDSLVLKAIDDARAKEGVAPMRFKLAAFRRMTRPEQLFVTVDLERTARGLAPIEALTKQLNTVAWKAARSGGDPSLPYHYPLQGGGAMTSWGGNWAGGNVNVLGSDYGWMYNDGPNSPNFDCKKAGDPGCWGHRDNILGDSASNSWGNPAYCGGGAYHFVMGAGSTKSVGGWDPSQTELFVLDCGKAPTEYFTWTYAKKLLGI